MSACEGTVSYLLVKIRPDNENQYKWDVNTLQACHSVKPWPSDEHTIVCINQPNYLNLSSNSVSNPTLNSHTKGGNSSILFIYIRLLYTIVIKK